MDKLRDIKGLMEIHEYSMYILMIIVFVVLLLLYFILKNFIFKKRKISKLKIAKKNLKNIDFLNSKKSAYTLSKYVIYVATNEEVEKLDLMLEKYKYKKDSQRFAEADLEKIKIFLSEHNV